MSTTTTKPTPTTSTPQQQGQTEKKPSRRRRFLQAMKLLAGKASVNNEKIAKKTQERFDSVKDKITGTMHENDCVRRLERLNGLITERDGDPRYQDAVDDAKKDAKSFANVLANGQKRPGTVDWTDLHDKIGVASEKLVETLDDRAQAERSARSDLPKQAAADLKAVEDMIATGRMSDDDRSTYTERLNRRQASLILAGQGNEQEAQEFPNKILELRNSLQVKVNENNGKTQRRMAIHTELSNRLAAAADGSAPEARVAIAELLQQALANIETCAFDAATTLLNQATTGLDKLGAPAKDKLPSADAMLKRLADLDQGMRGAIRAAVPIGEAYTAYQKYQTDSVRNKKVPPVPKNVLDLRERGLAQGNNALNELVTVKFMLEQTPDSAVSAARMLDRWEKEINQAKEFLSDAVKLFKNPKAQVGTGDGATERAKQLADTVKPIDDKLHHLEGLCTALYQHADPTATKAEGELLTRLDDLRQRWEATKGKALSVDDLDTGPFLKEIDRLEADQKRLDTAQTAGKFGKEDVDFDKQLAAYRTVEAELTETAKQVMERNSDEAIKLGLATKPSALSSKAEVLAGQQTQSRGIADDVTKRTAALLTLTNGAQALLVEAKKVAPAKSETELGTLRQECRDLIAAYSKRIDTAVKAAKDETLVLTVKRNEREALLKYAEALKLDMAGIAAPLASKDEGLIAEVKTNLTGFNARIIDFEKRAPGRGHDDSLPKLTKVLKKATELKTLLGHSLFGPRPDDVADENEQVAKIIEDYATLDPATTLVTLGELEKKINLAKQKAQGEHEAAGNLIFELEGLWPKVQKLKGMQNKKYDTYLADLVFRISKLVEDVRTKDKVEKRDTDSATALKTEAEGVLARPPRGLDAGQTAANDRQKELAAVTYRLDSIEDVDIKLLKEKAGQLEGEAATQLTKQIKSMETSLKIARGMIEKRDAAGAKELADAIQRQCKRMGDAPLGSSTRARNELPKVETRWKGAAKTMAGALDKLVETVRGADTGNTALGTAADALDKKLQDVRNLLREDAFAGPIKRMTAGKPKPADVGSAREDALREVRRINKMMDANPLLRQLAAIPFPGADLPLAEIGASLWDMETNLNISG
jgi:hypothetical protein